jgi:opacity protein-like surface antigen
MKYILLIAVFCSAASYAESYIKVDISHAGFSHTKHSDNCLDKSLSIGHYFNSNYRADLMLGEVSPCLHDNYIAHNEAIEDSTSIGTKRIKYSTNIRYFLFNNYLNIIKREDYNIFIVGGLGYARIKERVNALFSGMIMNGEVVTVPLTVDKFQTKKDNFIYSLGFGTGIKINKVVNLDISYSYRNFGKPKADRNIKEIGQVKHYHVHQVGIGIRINI